MHVACGGRAAEASFQTGFIYRVLLGFLVGIARDSWWGRQGKPLAGSAETCVKGVCCSRPGIQKREREAVWVSL